MFFHRQQLQFHAKPERPDPLYAKKLQEVLGGQWGEISVMMQYLFQGWNCRGPAKYRDLLLSTGTEEIAHVEMLATMIARLLEGAPVGTQEEAARDPILGAVMGGMNPQHIIVSGLGATPNDSVGVPWNGRYITASGNLLADMRLNLTAESQGRLQVCRLYNMTEDTGVRDMLSFLIARDALHQNQWIAAITDLQESGLEMPIVPGTFPTDLQNNDFNSQVFITSDGDQIADGYWASGKASDGNTRFEVAEAAPLGDVPVLNDVDPKLYGTAKAPVEEFAGAR